MKSLPPIYRRWTQEALEGPLPVERRADCSACPMVSAEGPAASFREDLKCCTFHPVLPSFSVGAFFREVRPELAAGRALLEEKLRQRVGVTPMGIGRPARFSATFRLDEDFGVSREFRCPYYVDGSDMSCGIWIAREATCATWYCKHERGRTGRALWEALRLFLQAMDRAMTQWCLLDQGLPPEQLAAIDDLFRDPPGDNVPPDMYEAVWGEHRFAEHRFYAACHEAVDGLSAVRAMAIGGPNVVFRAGLLRHAEAAFERELREPIQAAPTQLIQVRPKSYVLQTYSPYDLQDVPRELVDVLELFDGRPRADVVKEAAARGVVLDPAMIRHMVDFGLLTAG